MIAHDQLRKGKEGGEKKHLLADLEKRKGPLSMLLLQEEGERRILLFIPSTEGGREGKEKKKRSIDRICSSRQH